MLLLHQTGSVRVGEVVRYTLTYTPSADRILPAPQCLHVKVKNTSAIPLRAAYLHGPYTLSVACYPSTFDPNKKHDNHQQEGAPDFESNLKAGGQWNSKLSVPEEVRDTSGSTSSRQSLGDKSQSFSWIIEVASQVVFSTSAAVHFEVLVGRDERSVELGFYPSPSSSQRGAAGKVGDHISSRTSHPSQEKGIYSKAVRLVVEDTTTLWNSPQFPTWEKAGTGDYGQPSEQRSNIGEDQQPEKKPHPRKKRKIHLVVLTHGIHSNVGADLLYLKESIDAAAKQAREDARMRRAQMKADKAKRESRAANISISLPGPEDVMASTARDFHGDHAEQDDGESDDNNDEDDEQVIVRGFGGNTVRTERGIQYLGKRLAKYVLSLTYPDQPYLPVKSSISRTIARSLNGQRPSGPDGQPTHRRSSIHKAEDPVHGELAYQVTSVSFVGHSLGGLTQTYAIAYIHKHSPEFFSKIRPINFVAMASPFLGLSNENPIYVKFALDFGLVGRTGQDLGLTWRAPTMVRSGWDAMIGGLGSEEQKNKTNSEPGAKPLLRVLPTGPAHAALKMFRNRSIYCNVVNDGIVPLRTSCLLFLDWKGLGRVDKARREDGLVGTMVGWGWAEMMGQNSSALKPGLPWSDFFNDSGEESDAKKKGRRHNRGNDVPQPRDNATVEDDITTANDAMEPKAHQFLGRKSGDDEVDDHPRSKQSPSQQPSTAWSGLLSFFKPQPSVKPSSQAPKHTRIYHRGQTTNLAAREADGTLSEDSETRCTPKKPTLVRGPSLYDDSSHHGNVKAPPRTTFFESAGDVLKPPLPSREFLLDPAARPRTIFHDRVYHPEDIPAPASKGKPSFKRHSTNREATATPSRDSSLARVAVAAATESAAGSAKSASPGGRLAPPPSASIEHVDPSDMKIEEKIARAYHQDLSWRKVLVRLEPDAHNNMFVRRMFANAYGWPVVKHMCDTHFGFTASAVTADATEDNAERVHGTEEHVNSGGERVQGQQDPPPPSEIEGKRSELPRHGHSAKKSVTDGDQDSQMTSTLTPDISRLRGLLPKRTDSEIREATDEVPDLSVVSASTAESSMSSSVAKAYSISSNTQSNLSPSQFEYSRTDSARWSDGFFDGTDDDDDDEEEGDDSDVDHRSSGPMTGHHRLHNRRRAQSSTTASDTAIDAQPGTSEADIADFLANSAPPPPPPPPPHPPSPGRSKSKSSSSSSSGQGSETSQPLLTEEFTTPPQSL